MSLPLPPCYNGTTYSLSRVSPLNHHPSLNRDRSAHPTRAAMYDIDALPWVASIAESAPFLPRENRTGGPFRNGTGGGEGLRVSGSDRCGARKRSLMSTASRGGGGAMSPTPLGVSRFLRRPAARQYRCLALSLAFSFSSWPEADGDGIRIRPVSPGAVSGPHRCRRNTTTV